MISEISEDVLAKFKGKYANFLPAFKELHKFIMSRFPDVYCYTKTIYIAFRVGDNVMATVFFKGTSLDVGLALPSSVWKNDQTSKLTDAKYMYFRGITRSIKITSPEQIHEELEKYLIIAHEQAKNMDPL